MQYNINTIFPTTFISANINREITKEEMDVVLVNSVPDMTYANFGNTTSNNKYVLTTCKELSSILEFIQNGLKTYIDNIIIPKENIEFYITQSWLNYTKPGQFHHKHKHPNSLISGVFYFVAEEDKDKIYFFNQQYKRINIVSKELNVFNSDSWWFPVKTGELVLFDSSLEHMVETTVSSTTRISLAFNVFAKGYLGSEQELTALHL
jgi:uncharacterized protein (TIGR02466 family)